MAKTGSQQFATPVDSAVLKDFRVVAKAAGVPIQDATTEALRKWADAHRKEAQDRLANITVETP